jgi:nitrite reductase (NADH) large subunit
MRERLAIVGNGMASLRLVERLVDLAPGRFEVTVVGGEPAPAYNRVLLSSLLGGEIGRRDCDFRPASWYAGNGIRLHVGRRIRRIDPSSRTAFGDDGLVLPYDRLVLATGSNPIRLPVPGMDLPGVFTLRDLADVEAIRRLAGRGARAVVVGGGVLGIEAAANLARLGFDTTLIHVMGRLMERQLDEVGAGIVCSAVEARGVRVLLATTTKAIERRAAGLAVRTEDGAELPADLVLVSVGTRPRTSLASEAGLRVDRGVVVDDALSTSDPAISAVGECVEHRGAVYGLVAPIYEQADVLAERLCGSEAVYQGSSTATTLKVSGLQVFAGGVPGPPPSGSDIVFSDPAAGIHRKLVVLDGRLLGAVLVGDLAGQAACRALIRSGRPIGPAREDLVFGRPTAVPVAA